MLDGCPGPVPVEGRGRAVEVLGVTGGKLRPGAQSRDLPTEISALSLDPGSSWAEAAPRLVFRGDRDRKVPVLPLLGNLRYYSNEVVDEFAESS